MVRIYVDGTKLGSHLQLGAKQTIRDCSFPGQFRRQGEWPHTIFQCYSNHAVGSGFEENIKRMIFEGALTMCYLSYENVG